MKKSKGKKRGRKKQEGSLKDIKLSKKDLELIESEEKQDSERLRRTKEQSKLAEQGDYEGLKNLIITKAEISKDTGRTLCLDLSDGRTIIIHYWNIEKGKWRTKHSKKEEIKEHLKIKKLTIKDNPSSQKPILIKRKIKS